MPHSRCVPRSWDFSSGILHFFAPPNQVLAVEVLSSQIKEPCTKISAAPVPLEYGSCTVLYCLILVAYLGDGVVDKVGLFFFPANQAF